MRRVVSQERVPRNVLAPHTRAKDVSAAVTGRPPYHEIFLIARTRQHFLHALVHTTSPMNDSRMPQYRIGASTLSPQEGLTRSDPVRRWGHFANRSVRRCVRFWPKFRALLHYPTLWCIQG